jgi:tRNA(Ile)-lysidine synthase
MVVLRDFRANRRPAMARRPRDMIETMREQAGFLASVEATIRRYAMLDDGDTVVVGVSGGPDSVALLHILASLAANRSLRLVVAHLNHKLRGIAADQEAAFVRTLADRSGLPGEIRSQDAAKFALEERLSLQEAARTMRYAFYDEVAAKYSAGKIALGHHGDDNAESVLIHLLRGTGPLGLTGIPPVRNGRIIRPLMGVTRRQILAFLRRGGFEYMQDCSNADVKYLRNRIRQELLPYLRERYNPNIASALNRLSSILRDEENFWKETVEQIFQDLLLEQAPGRVTLPINGVANLRPALRHRLVRHVILSVKGDLRRLACVHVEAVDRLVQASESWGHLDLPSGVKVIRDRQEISFFSKLPEEIVSFEYDIPGIQTTLIKEIGVVIKLSQCHRSEAPHPKTLPPMTALFDLATVTFPLKARSLKPGDRFRPLGMGGLQKVKSFFINQKVPRSKRRRCPILLSREKIIWVGGYRTDDSVKITEKTERILKAELLPG